MTAGRAGPEAKREERKLGGTRTKRCGRSAGIGSRRKKWEVASFYPLRPIDANLTTKSGSDQLDRNIGVGAYRVGTAQQAEMPTDSWQIIIQRSLAVDRVVSHATNEQVSRYD